MIAESIPLPIYVVDTKNMGIASGLIVIEAFNVFIEQGLLLTRLVPNLDQASLNTRVYFVPSLEYLRKGGRISEAIYRIGSMFNIKPVLTCDERQIHHCQEDQGLAEISCRTDCIRVSLAQQFDLCSQWEFAVQRLISFTPKWKP